MSLPPGPRYPAPIQLAGFALLEMKVVLRALLSRCELGSRGLEVPRRRNITISPARGAEASLRARVPA